MVQNIRNWDMSIMMSVVVLLFHLLVNESKRRVRGGEWDEN